MPREVLVRWISELSGQVVGSTALRYGIDADEFVKKGLAIIVDEHPPPRNFLLTDGVFDVGVMSGSQAKMSEQEKKNEQQFLLDQVRALDTKHEEAHAAKELATAIAAKRKAVAHE